MTAAGPETIITPVAAQITREWVVNGRRGRRAVPAVRERRAAAVARARMPCPIASFRNRSRKGLKSERIEHEIGNRASLRYAMSTNFEW